MRYLNKVIFLNSAHVPYAEVKIDGNVHFIGTQGVGKSTLLRAILFFYNADKLKLGIPKEKVNFDSFYLPYSNSYIVYEVMLENRAYSIIVTKSMGRAAFRFVDAPYSRAWFCNNNEVLADWGEIRSRITESNATVSSLVTSYELYRDIIFGNNRKSDMVNFRKYAIAESAKYQNIPRTIQNVFLNSKLDANFIKDTIIQSMNEEELLIDLSYYRTQVEAFEQEYNDVMLWLKPNKNGEFTIKKQAEQVINRYRLLLYQKKQIDEGRGELNFAEKIAKQMLPVLEEQIVGIRENVERGKRLIGEEKKKYDIERDKLIKVDGVLEDKLKSIKEKKKYYENEKIEDVIKKVSNESVLNKELESLRKLYNELTSTYKDVISKYDRLSERLDNDLEKYKNEKNKKILQIKEEFNKGKEVLYSDNKVNEDNIREAYSRKCNILYDSKIQFNEDISKITQRKNEVKYILHFKKEIEECEEEINSLETQTREINLSIDKIKLECENLRGKGLQEKNNFEFEINSKINEATEELSNINKEIETLERLIDKRKGSFYDWLENNKSDWKDTIGKIVDEELVLYNQDLNPCVCDSGNSLFGVKIDLEKVNKGLRTYEQIKDDLSKKSYLKEKSSNKLNTLCNEKEVGIENIDKRYNKLIRDLLEKQHSLEAQNNQIPIKIKNYLANLATWRRKEDEWKQQQITKLETEIGEKTKELLNIDNSLTKLQIDKDKALKLAESELKKSVKEQEKKMINEIELFNNEINLYEKEIKHKKENLSQSKDKELKGSGADTVVISDYEQKINEIVRELEYINGKRNLVFAYEKDKHDYFDCEQRFSNEKKENGEKILDLDNKYSFRKNKLTEQLKEAEKQFDSKNNEIEDINLDINELNAFKGDSYLCPPDKEIIEEIKTRKTCRVIISELKSLILSIQKNKEDFKKSINLFNSNFTSKNTFNFVKDLILDQNYYDFASNLCEFVENNKIIEYQSRISERYANIIRRISKEVGNLTQNESEVHKTIKEINNDFIERNFAGVIRSIELRALPSNDKLTQLLIEIKQFSQDNEFNMGNLDLFSQESRVEVNEKSVKYLCAFSRKLNDEPTRTHLTLSDTFNLQFRIEENDNSTGWVEKISNVGSDGTDILVKAMVNIMLINVFKEKASKKFGEFKIHCMMDEIGKLHPNNVKGILTFANCRNILLINSSPTTYNVEDYKYTYLLSKDSKSNTSILPLLTRKNK